MLDIWISLLAGGAAGATTGAVASFVAPWANWGVEKRRQRLESRRKLIHEVRMWVKREAGILTFAQSGLFPRIRPHLTPGFRAVLDRCEMMHGPAFEDEWSDRAFAMKLLDEVAEVERHWGLA